MPGILVQLESKEKLAAFVPELPKVKKARYSGPQSPPLSRASLARAMSFASVLCAIIFFDWMCTK